MRSTADSASQQSGSALTHLMVFDDEPGRSAEMARQLTSLGFRATDGGPVSIAGEAFARDRPSVVVVGGSTFARIAEGVGLRSAAAALGVPIVAIIDDFAEVQAMSDRIGLADEWVSRSRLESELPARVARLLKRRGKDGKPAVANPGSTLPADAQFFALVVHDLRTPLNVIGLSLRMISQALPKGDAELDEDMRFVDENFRQIERMLSQLSDFYRLFETGDQINRAEFSPRRLIEEILEARTSRGGTKLSPVVLDVRPDCPEVVDLDPARARQAIQYALINATASASGNPIRLIMRGGPDRWVIEIAIDKPPPSSVQSVTLSPHTFERLCGFAAERRGMDLAIVAKVSEILGGQARLDVDASKGTRIVIDWPASLPQNPTG